MAQRDANAELPEGYAYVRSTAVSCRIAEPFPWQIIDYSLSKAQLVTGHPAIVNELLAMAPEDAMTLPLLSAMFRVVFTTELGFAPSHAMLVNCIVPKLAKTDG